MADFTSLDIQEELLQRIEEELASFLKCGPVPRALTRLHHGAGWLGRGSCVRTRLAASVMLGKTSLLPSHVPGRVSRTSTRFPPSSDAASSTRRARVLTALSPAHNLEGTKQLHVIQPQKPQPPYHHSQRAPPISHLTIAHFPGGLHDALGPRLLPPQSEPERVHHCSCQGPPGAHRRQGGGRQRSRQEVWWRCYLQQRAPFAPFTSRTFFVPVKPVESVSEAAHSSNPPAACHRVAGVGPYLNIFVNRPLVFKLTMRCAGRPTVSVCRKAVQDRHFLVPTACSSLSFTRIFHNCPPAFCLQRRVQAR